MERDYEIFKCEPDGSVKWCAQVSGLRNARLELDRRLRGTGKEHFAMHLSTREIVFAADVSRAAAERANKRIFQIAYDEKLRIKRAELLRSIGYAVISVMGNEAARTLLTTLGRDELNVGLFIVGHQAPAQTRTEMVDWLKTRYPSVRILALNPPEQEVPNADYNVLQNGPENWLPFVATNISPLQTC